jgi:hypothetical protein
MSKYDKKGNIISSWNEVFFVSTLIKQLPIMMRCIILCLHVFIIIVLYCLHVFVTI